MSFCCDVVGAVLGAGVAACAEAAVGFCGSGLVGVDVLFTA